MGPTFMRGGAGVSAVVRSWLYSVVGLLGFLVGVYLFLTFALPMVLPFAVGLILAELIDPIVLRLTWRGKVPRSAAVGVVILILVALILTAFTAGVARLVQEIQHITTQVPQLYESVQHMVTQLAARYGAFHASLPGAVQQIMLDNANSLTKQLSENLPTIAKTLAVFSGLPTFLANMVIALIATFFMSRDKDGIFAFLLSLFPAPWRPAIRQVKVNVWSSAMGFAKAQLLLILMTMVQSMIGLALIGSDYAVSIGLLVGLADLMPVLGPAAVFLPWIAYAFLFGSAAFGIKLAVLYGILTAVRQVLEPKLVGDRVGLHPLALLFSVYVGFRFFGALGFVAGPLVAILLKAMIQSGLLPSLDAEPPK